MTIAVTGASGFLGKKLVKALLAKEKYFLKISIHNKLFPIRSDYLKKCYGDLLNSKNLENFTKKTDIIIHLAGTFYPPSSNQLKLNLCGTINLLGSLKKNGCLKKIIFASSGAVYGNSRKNKAFTEKDSLLPLTFYGLSKLLAEEKIERESKKNNFNYSILRFSSIYGPEHNKGVIFNFINSLKRKNKIIIYGDGKQTRDFLYVDDAVKAILGTIETKKTGSEIFNISGKRAYSLNQVIKVIEEILGHRIKVEYRSPEEHVTRHTKLDCRKARKILSWQPEVSLEKGLRGLLKKIWLI